MAFEMFYNPSVSFAERWIIIMKKLFLVFFAIGAACLGGAVAYTKKIKELENNQQLVRKNDKIIQVLDEFLTIKQMGKNLNSYFKDNNYTKIAIYGMGHLGKRLYDELKAEDMNIAYLIDKKAEDIKEEIPVFIPGQELPDADVVIVTPVFYFHSIENELEQYIKCEIVSLEDVLDEVILSEY